MLRYPTLSRLLLAASLLATAGCKDMLELTPQDVVPPSQFYKTELQINQALLGAYGNLRGIYNNSYQFTELPSDNARTFSESESTYGPFDKLSWTPSTLALQGTWIDHYRTIANANQVLDRVEAVPFTNATLKTQYIAEAKFLRALMYFDLVRYFGDVPLVLKELTSAEEFSAYSRNPAAEVYAQMEKDLLDAVAGLAVTYPAASLGRATKGAARGLLGKVYIQQKKWTLAKAMLAELMSGGTYQLLPDYNNVFGLGKDNNAEILFAAQYVSGGNGEGNSFAYDFAPRPSNGILTFVAGNSVSQGTLDLFNTFEAGDLRKTAYVGVFTSGVNVYYYPKKFVYPISVLNEGDNDWPILRYADMVLLYAEALNNDGGTPAALTQINLIRKRAGLTALTGLSQADTQLAIEKERRVELCFEGHRWHDLIRWDKHFTTMQAFKAKYVSNDRANADLNPRPENRLYPIPSRELTLNSNLTQNPGY